MLPIGSFLKNFRIENGFTQEEVANHLGVSSKTISKWERGENYPDITFLPTISYYLGVSVDDLIGVNHRKEFYSKVNAQWEENWENSLHKENVALMKEALKTFPNDALLLVQLAASLESIKGTREEIQKNYSESADVQEHIIKYFGDSEIASATRFNICFTYDKLGNRTKAVEYAIKLPNLYKTRENALSYFLNEKDRLANSQNALAALKWILKRHISIIAESQAKSEAKIAEEYFKDLYEDIQ